MEIQWIKSCEYTYVHTSQIYSLNAFCSMQTCNGKFLPAGVPESFIS